MFHRLTALFHVFCKGWEFWSPIPTVIAIVLASQLIPLAPEARLRIAGLILQLLGVGVVALGIKHTRKIFGRKSYFAQAREWGRSVLAVLRPKEGRMNNVIEAPVGRMSVTALGVGVIRGGTALEQRVTALEDKVNLYDGRFHDLDKQLAATTNALQSNISGERDARMQADRLTREQLEAFSVGGIYIDIAGLFWLIFGILFATVPQEIVGLWCAATRQL